MSKKEISIHLSNTKRQDTKACCSKTNIKTNDTSIYIITYTCIINCLCKNTNTQSSKYVPKTQTKIRYLYPFKRRK